MYKLASLIGKLSTLEETRIVHSGYVVWLAWDGKLPESVVNTLSSFGGWPQVVEEQQALWFFPDKEFLKGLARLYKWSRLQRMPLFLVVFAGKLLVGRDLHSSLSVDKDLAALKAPFPRHFEVWLAEKLRDDALAIPGIQMEKVQSSDLTIGRWQRLKADENLSYDSSLSWIFVLRPQGNPSDRNFISGWKKTHARVRQLISRLKISFLYTDDFFLILHLENDRRLKQWCFQLLQMNDPAQNEEGFWPCVMAGFHKDGQGLSKEFPHKQELDWSQLGTDAVHLPLRDIYLLGSGFRPLDARLGGSYERLDTLFKMSLRHQGGESMGSLHISLPHTLCRGEKTPCFYCGLRTHAMADCPTKQLLDLDPGSWEALSALDIESLDEDMAKIDKVLEGDHSGGLQALVHRQDNAGIVIRSVFENTRACQLRMLRLVWRSRGRDWPEGLRRLSHPEGEYIWTALDRLRSGDFRYAQSNLEAASLRHPRNFQPRTLLGFVHLERGSPKMAQKSWQDAEGLCYTPLQRGYHVFLRARLMEIDGRFERAISLYNEALKISPGMSEARYRQAACYVKMGFSDQAMGFFSELMEENPHVFNMILLDPELDRGYSHLLSDLWKPWIQKKKAAKDIVGTMEEIGVTLNEWFSEDNPSREGFVSRLERLKKYQDVPNYVAYHRILEGVSALNRDVQARISQDIQELKETRATVLESLHSVQEEVADFPFAKIMRGFNKDFNYCAQKLNKVAQLELQVARNFRLAYEYIQEARERMKRLNQRLVSLRIIRDVAVFGMSMFKHFFWLEILGLTLCAVVLPSAVYYGLKEGHAWASTLVSQTWDVVKVVGLGVSIASLVGAGVIAAVRFEVEKRRMLERK